MNQDIETIVKNCRIFFETNKTKSYEFRISQLLKLQEVLNQNKKELLNALYSDLHKTEMEGFFSEFAIVRGELKFAIKHLKKWIKPKRVPTSIAHFKSSSKIMYEPFGTVLIMSPWNYPLNLTLAPLVGAIAAGNCAVVKALKLFSCNIGGYKKNNLRKLSAGIYIGNYRRAGRKLKTFGTAF